jgi:hypothetical protein
MIRYYILSGFIGFIIGLFAMAYALLGKNKYLSFFIDYFDSKQYIDDIIREKEEEEEKDYDINIKGEEENADLHTRR